MKPLHLTALLFLAAQGCTFGVVQSEVDVQSESAASFDTFAFEATDPALVSTSLVVRGDTLSTARASAHVFGLIPTGAQSTQLGASVALPFSSQANTLRLGVSIIGARSDTLWIETLSMQLPEGSSLRITSPDVHADVDGIEGAITIRDAQSVLIRHGNAVDVRTTGGNIDVHATSGSLISRGGNITLGIDAPITLPFSVRTEGGNIVITRAPNVGFMLVVDTVTSELNIDGSIQRVRGHLEQIIGEGGPMVHVENAPNIRIQH